MPSPFSFKFALLLLASSVAVSGRPHVASAAKHANVTLAAQRHETTVPAFECNEAAPFECLRGEIDFCCPLLEQCVDPTDLFDDAGDSKGGWGCWLGCALLETPCVSAKGASCCPVDLQCSADGQCVPKDADPADQNPVVCDETETLCNNTCCEANERCDAVYGCRGVGDMSNYLTSTRSPTPRPSSGATPTPNSSSSASASASATGTLIPARPSGINKNATAVTAHHRNDTGVESASSLLNAAPQALSGLISIGAAVVSSFFVYFSLRAVRG